MAVDQSVEGAEITYELPVDAAVTTATLSSGVTVATPVVARVRLAEGPVVELRLEVDGGKLALARLAIDRAPGGAAIALSALRDLPLASMVKEVRRRVTYAFSVLEQLGEASHGALALLPTSLARAPGETERTGNRRRVIDDGLLDEVDRVAASHPEAPTRAVQHQLGTSHRNATRWIAAARARARARGADEPAG